MFAFDSREMTVEKLDHETMQLKSIVCTFTEAICDSASDADDISSTGSSFNKAIGVTGVSVCWL